MSKFGRLQEFRSDAESVTAYLECVELFFTVNEIADDKKVTVFLSSMGSTTYTLLQDLAAPTKPADKTLEELFKLLKDHYNPTPGYSRTLQFSVEHRELQNQCQNTQLN